MFFRKSIAKVLADSDSRRVFLEIAYRSTEKASKQPSKLSEHRRRPHVRQDQGGGGQSGDGTEVG